MPHKLFSLILFLFPISFFGQEVVMIDSQFQLENICYKAVYFEDHSALKNIEDVLNIPSEFWIKNNNQNITGEVSSSNFWVKIILRNKNTNPQELALIVSNPLLDRVRFYCLEDQILVDSSMLMGDMFPFSQREVLHRYFIHYIKIPPQTDWEVYCMAGKTSGRFSFFMELCHQNNLIDYLNKNIFYWILLTIIIGISGIMGLVYYFISFEKAALAFFFQNLCGTLFLFANDGFGFQYIWPNAVWLQLGASLFFTATYYLFQASFVLHFFRMPRKSIGYRLLIFAIGLQIIAALCFFIGYCLPESYLIFILKPLGILVTSFTLFTNIIILLACIIYYFQTKDRNMRLFIVGILVPVFMGTLSLIEWLTPFMIPQLNLFETMALSGSIQNIIILFIAVRVYNERENEGKLLQQKLIAQQNESLQNLLKGQEIERKRLSRELHDGLSIRLSQFKLLLNQLLKIPPPDLPTKIDALKTEIEDVHQDIRNFSHALNPTVLQEFGLEKALNDLIFKIEMSDLDLDIQLNFPLEIGLSKEQEKHLFHILQELLNNTLKYACANQIQIDFRKAGTQLFVSYFDNGVGYNLQKVNRLGIGLKNIQSRVNLMRGQFLVEKKSPRGMTHKIILSE